jgi:cardiolipin synthase
MGFDLFIGQFFGHVWPHIVGVLTVLVTLLASGHAVLHKRETLSAVAWVAVIWLVPVVGAALYVLLGINRIKRRAAALRSDQTHLSAHLGREEFFVSNFGRALPGHEQFMALSNLVEQIVGAPLLRGNSVEPLVGGGQAYAAMVEAIEEARRCVALSTYIFDNDRAGRMFLHALAGAVSRGVDVRVLVDGVGARYSWPPMTRVLREAGVRVARFLPPSIPWRMPVMNLRNHRKILVADGSVGFTGGMNIREGNVVEDNPAYPIQDLHFRVQGPVVAHFQEIFADDWHFCTGERLEGPLWYPPIEEAGPVIARAIPDGPDEDYEKLLWTVQGALACARSSVRVVTPYFLPDHALITSLNLASMRGVHVEIILPEVNNLPMVKWASMALLPQVLEHGCRVWLTPPPFDHSKLMLVDSVWMLFGSGNWDARSFKLNFEFNVECYDPTMARRLNQVVDKKLQGARELTLTDLTTGRPLPLKLRDGVARLLSPYL